MASKNMKHTISDLYQMQALPLSAKIRMTENRIRGWVDEYGIDGVYVSFSGGKDSRVLLHIARRLYPSMKAVYADTGLEYPELREFVKTFDNVDWVRPKMNFKKVIEVYGYPFISKEVSEIVDYARKYMKALTDRQTVKGASQMADILGIDRRAKKDNEEYMSLKQGIIPSKPNARYQILCGEFAHKENGVETGEISKMYDKSRYKFLLDAPFNLSAKCCSVMKKTPLKAYQKQTGRMPITAQMASESKLRTTKWLQNGCNGFHMKSPISNPMAFWTEQDVLLYIKENNLSLASVYKDVVIAYEAEGQIEGQMDMFDLGIFDKDRRLLKTTGCSRSGCVFCGYGCHLESPEENRFEITKVVSNPSLTDFCMRGGAFAEDGLWKPDNRGLGYWFVMKWMNVHGGMNYHIPDYEKYEAMYGTEETRRLLKVEENG